MTDTAVTVTTLTANTVTADLITNAEGGTTVTTGNIAVFDVGNVCHDVIFAAYGSGASSITIQAGDKPPAERSGLGATSAQTVPASDLLLFCVEGGRFMQDNGTIRVTNSGANSIVFSAYRIPKTV